MFVDVMIPRSGKKAIFTYAVPAELQNQILNGLVVLVPFGKRTAPGVVWQLHTTFTRRHVTIKPIKKIIHPDLQLLPDQRTLALWMAEQFVAPLTTCVFSFLPILKAPPKDTGQTTETRERPTISTNLKLNAEQATALTIIEKSTKPVLLHGVTGSGKTEVYLQYAKNVLDQGKQVLMLVPEIALTPQTRKRFEERFGDIVAVWHSELGAADRRRLWWQIRDGYKKLIVGSRSAIFLPLLELGLIVIDEEHEKSFYQESSPRYDARTIAEYLNGTLHTRLILGSATPRLESVWKVSTKAYTLARLSVRIGNAALPDTRIIDLRQERLKTGKTISAPLASALQEIMHQKRQAVLLLNRRGHSTTAQCTTCGLIMLCQNCNVPLVVHQGASPRPELRCHHCDHKEPAPTVCPSCRALTVSFMGFGTEKVEREIGALLPEVRILRMDRDTTRTRDTIDRMYHDFATYKYDILLGTQMIAKGWDIPNVDLVGILLAEGGLMLPDFHAAENTFNLLVQVSGRSGRGRDRGMTMMQTYLPEHTIIRAAANHDFGSFVKEELKNRQAFSYPPFSHIVRLLFQDRDQPKCERESTIIARQFEKLSVDLGVQMLGPAPCFFERLRGKYRYHLIIKVLDTSSLKQVRDKARSLASPWTVEIDPPQLL